MPTYVSMHIIACMTRQALARLIATLQAAQEVTLVWASASQLGGRLICKFDAPDQGTLLRFFAEQHLAYEWIIRVELAWGTHAAMAGPAREAAPGAGEGGRFTITETPPRTPVEEPPEQPTAMEPSPATSPLAGPVKAKVLHILRALRDESAWQLIAAQREPQPVAVLLLHDAVLAPPPLDAPMFACEADVRARGTPSPLPLLTYDQIVALVFVCEHVIVW